VNRTPRMLECLETKNKRIRIAVKLVRYALILQACLLALICCGTILAAVGLVNDTLFVIPTLLSLLLFVVYSVLRGSLNTKFLELNTIGWTKAQRILFFSFASLCIAFGITAYGLSLANGGGPDIKDGVYCITSHGEFVREITQDEYRFFRAFDRFGFAAPLFSLFAYFLTVIRRDITRLPEEIAQIEQLI